MKTLASLLVVLAGLMLGATAFAQDSGAQPFVQSEQTKLSALLRSPPSGTRDSQIDQALDRLVDYEEMTRRALGQPCPVGEASCQNHWAALTDAQKAEVTDLLKKLVQKNYRKNLMKTLDYDVTYRGARDDEGNTRIRTEAKSKLKPRDPAVQVDYVVRSAGGYHVIDIVTEGSSLTKNYYDQFHKMLTNPAQGYPHMVGKLREKIAKKD
jgi:ABC-type transporter MlaC component